LIKKYLLIELIDPHRNVRLVKKAAIVVVVRTGVDVAPTAVEAEDKGMKIKTKTILSK
jgi:hypothetical protein